MNPYTRSHSHLLFSCGVQHLSSQVLSHVKRRWPRGNGQTDSSRLTARVHHGAHGSTRKKKKKDLESTMEQVYVTGRNSEIKVGRRRRRRESGVHVIFPQSSHL